MAKDNQYGSFSWTTDMTIGLGLKGNELLVYSVISSFCQRGMGAFWGSLNMLSETIGATQNTTIAALKKLQERGLIEKFEVYEKGEKRVSYRTSKNAVAPTSKIADPYLKNCGDPTSKIADNNKVINDVDKSTSKKISDYTDANFKADVIALGVPEDDATAWMKVRKKKGGVSSERAFELTKEEIEKSGYSAEQCVKVAILRSWCGIKADWVQNHMAKAMSPQQAAAEAEKARQERIRELQEKTVRRSTC